MKPWLISLADVTVMSLVQGVGIALAIFLLNRVVHLGITITVN